MPRRFDENKWCGGCGSFKHYSRFGRLKSSNDGLRWECNDCRTYARRKKGEKERTRLTAYQSERECIACKETKPLSEFWKNPATTNGRSQRCSACSLRRKGIIKTFLGVKPQHRKNGSVSPSRVCPVCQNIRQITEYPIARQCVDGHATVCKPCKNAKAMMKKLEINEPSEHEEAVGFHSWFVSKFPDVLIYHIPNGMKRDVQSARKLKDEGIKAGMPDYHIPAWNLWVEMKRQKSGSLSHAQKKMILYLEGIGHTVFVTRGATDASRKILMFLQNRACNGASRGVVSD